MATVFSVTELGNHGSSTLRKVFLRTIKGLLLKATATAEKINKDIKIIVLGDTGKDVSSKTQTRVELSFP
jgi:hypothetical protein